MNILWVASSLVACSYDQLLRATWKHLWHAGTANSDIPPDPHHTNYSFAEGTKATIDCPLLHIPSLRTDLAQHQATAAMGIPRTPVESAEEERMEKKRHRVEESEDEESIIKRLNSYAPLSNLPTPPISQETSPRLSIIDGPVSEPGCGLTRKHCRIIYRGI
jgi:hypothetical protein